MTSEIITLWVTYICLRTVICCPFLLIFAHCNIQSLFGILEQSSEQLGSDMNILNIQHSLDFLGGGGAYA